MTPVVIVPGLGGSGEAHWQTHLQRSLPNATRVQQDDWERPELTRWVERLACELETRRNGTQSWSPTVWAGHSSRIWRSCAHYLSIKGALLVAPADVDSVRHTPSQTRGFAPIPLCPLPFRSIVVASTNDPFMEFERARELAATWGADFVDAGPIGHINVDSGFGPWTAGQRMVDSLNI